MKLSVAGPYIFTCSIDLAWVSESGEYPTCVPKSCSGDGEQLNYEGLCVEACLAGS